MQNVTYICCQNNKRQLEEMLLPSIALLQSEVQHSSTNLILIDAQASGYKSAAEAFNVTIKERICEIGDIIVFCHQDIAFNTMQFHQRLLKELTQNPFQILGVAGIDKSGTVFSNLKYRENNEFITKNRLKEKTEVVSVDECCFATSKNFFLKLMFDDINCSHWHLYAVDLCYQAHLHGGKSFVLPESIYHKENNEEGMYTDMNFIKTMWNLVLKYRKHYTHIYAPCYICNTNILYAGAKLLKTILKNIRRI